MKITKTDFDNLIVIESDYFKDDRGYFAETFRIDQLEDYLKMNINFVQDNESCSKKNVLRGLHFQAPPFAQSKLVRVLSGSVLDIVVDIRKGSKTYGQYLSFILSSENKKQLFIPKGYAHGFLSLEDNTIFSYKVDNRYNAEHDYGINFADSSIDINWHKNHEELIISDKDKSLPQLSDIPEIFNIEENYYE